MRLYTDLIRSRFLSGDKTRQKAKYRNGSKKRKCYLQRQDNITPDYQCTILQCAQNFCLQKRCHTRSSSNMAQWSRRQESSGRFGCPVDGCENDHVDYLEVITEIKNSLKKVRWRKPRSCVTKPLLDDCAYENDPGPEKSSWDCIREDLKKLCRFDVTCMTESMRRWDKGQGVNDPLTKISYIKMHV